MSSQQLIKTNERIKKVEKKLLHVVGARIKLMKAAPVVQALQYIAVGHRDLPKERCEVFANGKSAVLDYFRTTTIYGGGKKIYGRQAKGFTEELYTFLDVCRQGGP